MEYLAGSQKGRSSLERPGSSRKRAMGLALIIMLLASVAVALVRAPSANAVGDPTMSIEKVEPGMVGYAKTVTTGTAITTFTVTVIDVVDNQNNDVSGLTPGKNLILFRASGPVIDQAGGVVEGMSGSPIYLTDPDDHVDKIVGAIAFGVANTDSDIALATPIDEMLPLLHLPGIGTALPQQQPATYAPVHGRSVSLGGGRILNAAVIDDGTVLTASPGSVVFDSRGPVISVAGIDTRLPAYGKLRGVLEKKGFTVTAPGGRRADASVSTATIEPGATLGAGLVTGDATIAAIGTVTYTDGNEVLGFGHPMFWQGATDMPLMTGYVYTLVKSLVGGYKLASAGDTTGTIQQDRWEGVAGTLQHVPSEAALSARAENADDGSSTAMSYRLSKAAFSDSSLAEELADSVLANTDLKAFKAQHSGTADTTFTIAGTTHAGKSFSLDFNNKVFDEFSIGSAAPQDFMMGLDALLTNEFEDVTITDMSFAATMTAERKTARVVGASLLGRRIVPGTTATVRVSLVPYNSDATQTVDATLAIPAGFPASATLSVQTLGGSGGAIVFVDGFLSGGGSSSEPGNVAELIADFESQQRNNELEITLIGGSDSLSGPSAGGGPEVTRNVPTQWVLSGSFEKATSSISMSPSPSSVVYNGAVRFSGSVADLSDPFHFSPLSGRPKVELWMTPYGTSEATIVATTLGSATTGAYAISYAPTVTGTFYTHFTGDETLLDASSTARAVNVLAKVTLVTSRSIVTRGHGVTLSGGVRPVHPGNVTIQRLVSGRWLTFKVRPLVSGNYSWVWTPTRAGTYTLRTFWAGDGDHKANSSSTRIVRVT